MQCKKIADIASEGLMLGEFCILIIESTHLYDALRFFYGRVSSVDGTSLYVPEVYSPYLKYASHFLSKST